MNTYNKIKKQILTDSSTSFWIKKAIEDLDKRDINDALNDIELLQLLFDKKVKEVLTIYQETGYIKRG